jgi:leucyl aminopeptidase
MLNISFVNEFTPNDGLLVVPVFEGAALSAPAQDLQKEFGDFIEKFLKTSTFTGKKDEIAVVSAPLACSYASIILLGLGDIKKLSALSFEELGAKLSATFLKTKAKSLHINLSHLKGIKGLSEDEAAAYLASGFKLRSYRFDKYKTKKKDTVNLEHVQIHSCDPKKSEAVFKTLSHIADGVFLTRDVVTETPNVLYPESMAEIALELSKIGLRVEIFGEKEMQKLGMHALLGVGQGSIRESKLIVLQWNGGAKDQKPVAIVGKGVTFDTGGISIKPSADMDEMKYDMAGSGVVIGLMKALALRKANVNVVGIMGMVENMPSGSAQRPGDVVTSMSGQTIEILNTDAEGRLVLADALWYTQDRFKPQVMIDLATLTGAIKVALGQEYAGLFSNNHDVAAKLMKAGDDVGEPVWRLPLGVAYDKDIDSDIADMKNLGSGRGAGSITAAQFLQRFVNETPWAHLDIAGMAWDKKDKPLSGKGATSFGVRLLNKYIHDNFEQ